MAGEDATTPPQEASIRLPDEKWAPAVSEDIFHASSTGHAELVKHLLQDDAIDVNEREPTLGRTALRIASFKGHTEVVKLLLQHEAIDINSEATHDGWNALHSASCNGHGEVVGALLQQGWLERSSLCVE